MKSALDLGIAVIAVTLMAAIGLALDARLLARTLRPARPILLQLAATIGLPPLAGLLTVWLLKPPPEIAAGILLLAACPVGDIANIYTLHAKGSTARSLVINAMTAIAAPLTMTMVLSLYEMAGRSESLLVVPAGPLFIRLSLLLAGPVAAGMLIRHHWPAFARRAELPLQRFTAVGIILMVALVFLSPVFRNESYFHAAAAALVFLGFCGALAAALFLLSRGTGRGERIAGLMCLPVRNVGVAALIALGLLGRHEMAAVLAVYFVIEVPLMWALARFLAGRRRGENLTESSSSA